tara:strand:- start:81 stop:596 length:516 start_codon:yes stop_codon:yes gene_type:complete
MGTHGMNKTQKQRAIDAFADDCEITSYYFGFVDDFISFEYDDDGVTVGTNELADEGFSEIVQGPTCAIGALIVDLWKGGELTSESVENVMLYTNDSGYSDLPAEIQDTLQEVYGLDSEQFCELQNINDRVSELTTGLRWDTSKTDDMNDIYGDHISTRESLVISTLLNFDQ